MIRGYLTISLLLLTFCSCLAQRLSGRVVDMATREPIPSASIISPETGEGTVADSHGNFSFYSANLSKVKKLIASCVGYKPANQVIGPDVRRYDFELQVDTTLLKEVTITAIDPLTLIRTSLKKMNENHGGQRMLTCFYRMVSKNRQTFIQISEAAFELNQHPGQYNQVRVLRAREAEDEKAFNGVGMGLGTPVGALKNLDVTMNPEMILFSRADLRKHNFFYEGIATRDGEEVHEISFDQKNVKEPLYKGRLYLHAATLAFVHFEYELSPKGIAYFHVGNLAEQAALKLLGIGVTMLGRRMSISYRPYGNRWYISHVVAEESVRAWSRRYNFDVPVTERREFLVAKVDTTFHGTFQPLTQPEKIHLEEASDSSQLLWADYNIIPSTLNYDSIGKEISLRNNTAVFKAEVTSRLKDFPKDKGVKIDCVLTYYFNKGLFNGTALIKNKGKVILHKGYGFADKDKLIRNDTSTVFRIGSIAKTFTARVIWLLQQDGILNYTDSVQRFIPWYPHHGITIHHLLTHSSGIPNYTDNASFIDSIATAFTVEQLIWKFGREKPKFSAGARFDYSNTGYTLLALIAEKATGKTFETLLKDMIITPLRLDHTSFGKHDQPGQAIGYWNSVPEPYYETCNMAGAGSLSSSASDLLKWDEAHNDPGTAVLFERRTWYHDWGAHYGYGWNIDKHKIWASKRHDIQYHGGTDFGFKSFMARQPDRDNLVVLLNNTGEFTMFDVADVIFNILN